jgi:drug/metabolite transporter (DMT)-like permease
MWIDIPLFALGILLGAFGSILFKMGAPAVFGQFAWKWEWVWMFLTDWRIMLGFFAYFIPALIWIYLLSKHPISLVQPILALTYVVTPLLAILLVQEEVSALRWTGIAVIIVGVFIVSRS